MSNNNTASAAFSSVSSVTPRRLSAMPSHKQSRQNPHTREKKPPLTHFLCFPLVNETSQQQLGASFAKFQAEIPPRPRTENDHPLRPIPPLFPKDAIRPVGTLHLTLGVMSLSTTERLEAALDLLRSLDLTSMLQEAQERARKSSPKPSVVIPSFKPAASSRLAIDNPLPCGPQEPRDAVFRNQHTPLLISLESLHALPRPRSARVLYANPVDPSSRLYPFSEIIRDRFLEAGFLEGEYQKTEFSNRNPPEHGEALRMNDQGLERKGQGQFSPPITRSRPHQEAPSEESNLREAGHTPNAKKLKPRPLLLHATVANTSYVRGRRRNNGPKSDAYTFDARNILSCYRDYYLDEGRTESRPISDSAQVNAGNNEDGDGGDSSAEEEHDSSWKGRNSKAGAMANNNHKFPNPFIWAEGITLDKLCICEMGAKKIDGDTSPDRVHLGEEYTVVAERSLAQ
jgi:activating signal cointegrator complex subunit 1